MKVVIGIYDGRERRIKTLCDGETDPGKHLLEWDGTSDKMVRVPSGTYYLRVDVEGRGTVAKFKIKLE